MIHVNKAFNGFSVNDLPAAKDFYGKTLGVGLNETPQGLWLLIGNGLLVYPKQDHVPATFTVLNFPVVNIDQAVDDLTGKGITFELYAGITDHKGIARGLAHDRGPDIAWFKDPAGNILSVLQQEA